ncbi:MAG: YqjF family protein [Salibacteraceae bacterium]
MSFLTAEWRKLIFANYSIDPQLLQPHVPPGTELDLWEGHCYASLIGFLFKETKVLGVKVPFHVNFEEVNLRFYVKRNDQGTWKRGVVFIKEIVPKAAITFVANTLYGEHYETQAMDHHWTKNGQERNVGYRWRKNGVWNAMEVKAALEPSAIPEGSQAEFITEHYWGYAKINNGASNEYEVTHPRWEQYAVESYGIEADFGANYGAQFAFLNERTPDSVFLAEGSAITVEGKKKIFGE